MDTILIARQLVDKAIEENQDMQDCCVEFNCTNIRYFKYKE